MFPAAFVLLLLAALNSESTAAPAENSTGLNFFVVFPENIAYYHPDRPQNKVLITALYDDTNIHMKQHTYYEGMNALNAGQTEEYTYDARLELNKSEISSNVLSITSDKRITIQAVSMKNNSLQTALVMPADKLGRKYLIPPVPTIKGTTDPAAKVSENITERSPFRVFIVNPDNSNTVTLSGRNTRTVSLQPNQTAQILLKKEDNFQVVTATNPVAVLFGHPCALRHNCTCGLLYAMLPPARDEALTFLIPPALAKGAEEETVILLSEPETTTVKHFDPSSPQVKITGAAFLYRPGLLLALIPETDFGGCYVVAAINNVEMNSAVIVVHKDATDGVHVGSERLSAVWETLMKTEYVSTVIPLGADKTVIWHSYSKMAVYHKGNHRGTLFGNPAPLISLTPDAGGCTLTEATVEIGVVPDGWRESLQYCENKNLELVSLAKAAFQKNIHNRLSENKDNNVEKVWIGMRRSSLTGEWYWVNEELVETTNWEEGEPGTVKDGHCVVMSLNSRKDFGWSDEDCCQATHPICYGKPEYLP